MAERVLVQASVSKKVLEWVKERAAAERRSVSAWLRNLLVDEMRANPSQRRKPGRIRK